MKLEKHKTMNEFNTISEAIDAIQNGEIIVVVDDPDRENEGDLVMAAEKVTSETINFMLKNGRGMICLPATTDRLSELHLPLMVNQNNETMRTAFSVTIDAKGVKTGISAYERAMTIRRFIEPDATATDFMRPGHIFPLQATEGGVLRRAGHTEAAVDLAELAGLYPAGVICEILNDDGTMARTPELLDFASFHKLKIVNIADLIAYRLQNESLVKRVAEASLPTQNGNFRLYTYNSINDEKTHIALVKGQITSEEPTLVRVHSQCLTGDIFGSLRCDCGQQLEYAMQAIEESGCGVILYMRQEGRGMGLDNKIRAYQLQDIEGLDTVEANEKLGFPPDLRDYGIGAQILSDLGVSKMSLMTNNPRKISGLNGYNLEVVARIPIEVPAQQFNCRYLETKRSKLGHLILQEMDNQQTKDTEKYAEIL